MRKILAFVFLLVFVQLQQIYGQENIKKFEPGGKFTGQVFFNYHYDLTKDAEKKSQFEILRSNFGYQYNFREDLTAKVVLDAANDGKAFSMFLKNASLEWKINNMFTVEGGMSRTFMFDTQEELFGYRYVMESFQDKEKFYSTYDLGMKLIFKPVDIVQIRFGMFNGEGYKKLQDNFGVHRKTIDLILKPLKGITLKTYYDYMPKRDTAILDNNLLFAQRTLNFMAGYENPKYARIGVEYNTQYGNGNRRDYNLNGISLYGSVVLKQIELFARYDELASNTLVSDIYQWNIARDYSMYLVGIHASPAKGIKTSLNYRHMIPKDPSLLPANLVYLNFDFKF